MPLTDVALAEIEQRADRARPLLRQHIANPRGGRCVICHVPMPCDDATVAASAADVPALVAEVRALRELARLGLEQWRDIDPYASHNFNCAACGEAFEQGHAPTCWSVRARALLGES